ncbi:MAG TPA: hypothetical protein EYH56_03290 [Nanoarchaeota archaeon]|nr:hypothetical protein [Nanoarchaeota archaeon]
MIKVRQEKYPYLATRFRVRKSKLLKREEYEKMLKMDIYTLIKFLEEKGYEFEKIEEKNPFELVERSVNINLEKELSNILKITHGNAKRIFEIYLLKYDIENVKNLLRCKKLGNFQEEIFICAGKLKREKINTLKDSTIEEILKALKFLSEKEIKKLAKWFEENRLIDIENYIDKKYYGLITEIANKLKKEGEILKKFLKLRLDIINLRILLKFKHSKLSKEDVLKLFVFPGTISKKELEELRSLELEEIHSKIVSRFGEFFKDIDIKSSPEELDAKLEVYHLKLVEKFMHTNPLSITPLIAYVIMKETEARNIKLIARAKYYGLSENEIRKNLVIWQ